MEFEGLEVADRSERAKLRLTGEQRGWFLHQIVTNHFEDIRPGDARAAAMLTVKGRMVGFFEAVATEDAILVHFEPELAAEFPDVIRRYVFATRVEIIDATDDYGLVLIVGDGWRDLAGKIPGGVAHETNFIGPPAGYVWVPRPEVEEALAISEEAGAHRAGEDEVEAIRIAHGRPRWGRDMNEKSLPQEARLEDFGALDFDKGCYVGQEAVAKIFFRGKVNRKVWHLESGAPVKVGDEVTKDGEVVGAVTSAAGTDAIAVLKHTATAGDVVTVGGGEATVSAV